MIAAGLIICVVFVELVARLRLMNVCSASMGVYSAAWSVLRSSTLSDDEKEVAARGYAVSMLKETAKLIASLSLIAGILYITLLLLAAVLSVSQSSLFNALLSTSMVIMMTVFSTAYIWIRNVIRQRLQLS